MSTHHKIDMLDPLNSCTMQDPQALLSKALESRNIRDFKIALDMEADPTRMDPNTNLSLFEKAIQTAGCSEFVEECIRRGCKCDYINHRSKKAPINYASDSKDPKTMLHILKLKNIPVNTKYSNLTPLNSLAKNLNAENYPNVFECIKLLINYGANPNIPDQTERTPILYIINNKKIDNDQKKKLIEYLLEKPNIDLDTFRDSEARVRIQSLYPDIKMPNESSTTINFEKLLSLLRNSDEDIFKESFKDYQLNISNRDNQQNSVQEENVELLIESIKLGLNNAVNTILETGLNINLTHNGNSPIEISCIWGNWKALKQLLDEDDLKLREHENLLITIIKRLDESVYNNFSNYYTCFYTLLNSNKIDINEVDKSGSSALHYAVKYKNEKAISELLKRGAYLGTQSIFNDLPITEINPEILEDYFDSCITTNGLKPGDIKYEIIINYMNLIPQQNDDNTKNTKRVHTKVKSEMIPIEHMAESKELRHLLKHPLITSFLFLKWHRLSIIFYINFLLYAIFFASLVTFIILKFDNTAGDALITLFYILSLFGLFYMIIREIIQFIICPQGFIYDIVNYLEIALIILTIITLSEPNYEQETQRVLAVFTILFSSIELCWLVGSLPVLSISTHMLMLRQVSKSFLKSFALYSIFIITFSLCFYILFGKPGALLLNATENYVTEKVKATLDDTKDEDKKDDGEFNNFAHPFTAVIKTIVMLTGEFDAGDINFHSYYSYLVFLLFVFYMSIVLFNLLNGLAVSDTQAIKSQAELNGSICRTNILSRYERAMAGKSGKAAFLVNRKPFRSICKRLTNIFPDSIHGNHIAILPNDRNKILIPIARSTELGPTSTDLATMELATITELNGTSVLLTKNNNNTVDIGGEKKLLDPPVQFMQCCCSCISGKCSEMDIRTVKTAQAIIEKKYQNSKIKNKIQESEDRLKKIEDKLENVFELLQIMSRNVRDE